MAYRDMIEKEFERVTAKQEPAPTSSNFELIAARIGKLVTEKNKAYGNAFMVSSDILKLIFPNGVKPEQYTDLLLVNRIIDKLLRIAKDKNAFGEDPFEDITGYGILGVSKHGK